MTKILFNPFTGRYIIFRRKRRKAPLTPEVEALRARAKASLPGRLAELASAHGFTYNKVFIKNNVSNWGSCSVKGNINLNLRLVNLPEELRDDADLDSKFDELQDRYEALFIDDGKRFEYIGFGSEAEKASFLHDWGIAVSELTQKAGDKYIIIDEIEQCI